MMSFPKTSRVLPANSDQQINMLSKVYACTEMTFLGGLTAYRFYFDHFHISVYNFIGDRKHHKTISRRDMGEGVSGCGGVRGGGRSMSSSLLKFTLLTFVII